MSAPVARLPTRRSFVTTAMAATALSALDGIERPHLSRAADRPVI
jgi:hypothetical protein